MVAGALQFECIRYCGAAEAAHHYPFQHVRSAESIGQWALYLQDVVRKHRTVKQTHHPEVQIPNRKADQLFVTSLVMRQHCFQQWVGSWEWFCCCVCAWEAWGDRANRGLKRYRYLNKLWTKLSLVAN